MAKLRAVPAADPQPSLQSSLTPQKKSTEKIPAASGHAELIIIFRWLTPTLSDGLCEDLRPLIILNIIFVLFIGIKSFEKTILCLKKFWFSKTGLQLTNCWEFTRLKHYIQLYTLYTNFNNYKNIFYFFQLWLKSSSQRQPTSVSNSKYNS